jgi:hypothetical protein
MNDPYWTLDTSLFDGQFRYFGSDPIQVRGKAHTEQERYSKSDVNLEITPISITQGERTYCHLSVKNDRFPYNLPLCQAPSANRFSHIMWRSIGRASFSVFHLPSSSDSATLVPRYLEDALRNA